MQDDSLTDILEDDFFTDILQQSDSNSCILPNDHSNFLTDILYQTDSNSRILPNDNSNRGRQLLVNYICFMHS